MLAILTSFAVTKSTNYSECRTPYVYLKCFVLGDVIEVHGANRVRNLSNRKTITQAVYGLWLYVAVFGGMELLVVACGGLWLFGCLCLWRPVDVCKALRRLLQYFACKSLATNPMFVPNAISAVFRM